MTQSKDEIKMNSNQKPVAVTVSRDFKRRELSSETKLEQKNVASEVLPASRREFFQSVIPASGKLLTTVLRSVGTQISSVIEDSKKTKKS